MNQYIIPILVRYNDVIVVISNYSHIEYRDLQEKSL